MRARLALSVCTEDLSITRLCPCLCPWGSSGDRRCGAASRQRRKRKSLCKRWWAKRRSTRTTKSKTKNSHFRSYSWSNCDRPCSCSWNDNEGSRTKSTTQFEQILCGHHDQDLQGREQVNVLFFSFLRLKVYCIHLIQYISFWLEKKKIYNTCPFLLLLYVYICKSIFPFVELQDYQMRVEGLLCSPNSKSFSLLIWFVNTMPSDCVKYSKEL